MVEIKVEYFTWLVDLLDDLLQDLRVSNPEYRTAFDLASNPVITTLAKVLERNPTYFAEPTSKGVTFDMKKLNSLREELIQFQMEAIETAKDVIVFELIRLRAEGEISVNVVTNKIELQYKGKKITGSAENIIKHTVLLQNGSGADQLWMQLSM